MKQVVTQGLETFPLSNSKAHNVFIFKAIATKFLSYYM